MKATFSRRIDAALGRIPCDLNIKNVTYLDVFHGEWRSGDVSVIDGTIVALESGLKAHREVDGSRFHLVPGFIDAHVHIESSLMMPGYFEQAVLPRGTTTAICDPHELANVLGVSGIQYFLEASESLALNLRVMLSSCVPATHMETNGGGVIRAQDLAPLSSHPSVLGLAEMMNVPGVLFKDADVLAKLEAFSNHPMDGHCPLVTGAALSAYASVGISSCHESSQIEEAREKLTKGISVWIREGSVAKDLDALAPLLSWQTSSTMGFCTDDRNPLDIELEGHLDHLIRGAIRFGIDPKITYRASSWSVARHYGLKGLGAIAPGYRADLVLLSDPKTCAVHSVYKSGLPIEEVMAKQSPRASSAMMQNTIRAVIPEVSDLEGPRGQVHVIGVEPGRILTSRSVQASDASGVARLSVLERYGRGSKPANGYVTGFGKNFRGAIASSVGHDSHNLIVVGDRPEEMRVALSALSEVGGGFCVAQNGQVLARLPLPVGGLMSDQGPRFVTQALKELRAASRVTGCELAEPFLQLAFLSLPVIPSLKLTDRGLVDVDKFEIIDVRAS